VDIRDLIKPEHINLNLQGATKDEVIREMVHLLDENGILLDRQAFYHEIIQREKQHHTGIGFGIAIPHGKSSAVRTPSIACGKTASGMNWDEEGNKQVQWIFMIAVPENQAGNEHLKILQMLAARFIDSTFREQLANSRSATEVFQLLTQPN
jgi:fructose-specific phosphotransferase system IIA component